MSSQDAIHARTPSPKSILIYSENYLPGGTERCLVDLANHLDRKRYTVAMWINSNPEFGHGRERLAEDIDFRQIPILAVGPLFDWLARRHLPSLLQIPFKVGFLVLRYLFFVFNIVLLGKYLRDSMPDVLQVLNGGYPGGESCQAAVLAGRIVGVPHIFFYSLNTPFPVRIPLIERWVDTCVAHSVHRMLFNSKAACALMSQWRHVDPKRLGCVYSGSLVTSPSPEDIAAARQWIGAPVGRKLIGEIAIFEPRKGQHILLEASRAVISAIPNAHFILVGDGNSRQQLENLARLLGVVAHVTFAGFYRGNIFALMAALDVITLPTFQEGLPYAIEEAMAMGKPIVTTPVGGIVEQVVDGESALLVPPGDSRALANGLQRILTDQDLAARLGRNAQARFNTLFSLDRMIGAFNDLYTNCDLKAQ